MKADVWTYAWYAAALALVGYALHLFIGSVIAKERELRMEEIHVSHRIENRAHVLSGIVMAPSSCIDYALDVYATGASHQHLAFTKVKNSEHCVEEPAARAFRVTIPVTAPDERFTASIDGRSVPLVISE